MFDDPGDNIGPKSCGLWKPVIGAVNGMACGGAFYLLGEVEFIIAADHATFFDPHVTYGMTAAFEPIHMAQRMPFGEIMRLSLLGNHERMSARRAHEIGLVSEVVPAADLLDAARWCATRIASQPPLAVQGTVRSIWAAREMTRSQALWNAFAYVSLGTDAESLRQGQERFASGERIDPRIR
jgi:enoyl-CoA hydratase/carnithine racemase